MQINKTFVESSRNMNLKYMFIVAAMAVMLVGATGLAATDNAFADKKRHDDKKRGGYESGSQSLAQASECGNGFISVADFCQEIGSQNQGKENDVRQSGEQKINIDVELGDDLTSSLLGEPASSLITEEIQ
jgi:hypothetical protein